MNFSKECVENGRLAWPMPFAKMFWLLTKQFSIILFMLSHMSLFRPCLICLLITLFLAGCTDTDNSRTTSIEDENIVKEPFTIQKAMESLYGSNWVLFDTAIGIEDRIAWNTVNATSPISIPETVSKTDTVYVKILYSGRFKEAGQEKIFLITEATLPNYQCSRECSSVIGGAIFSRNPDGWDVTVREDHIITLGGWRNGYGNGSLAQIGADKYGFFLNRFLIGTGTQETLLLLIAEVDGKMRIILNDVSIGGENKPCGVQRGMSPCWYYSSTIQFVPDTNRTFNNLHITTTSDQNFDLSNTIRVFSFVDGEYQLIEQQDIPASD